MTAGLRPEIKPDDPNPGKSEVSREAAKLAKDGLDLEFPANFASSRETMPMIRNSCLVHCPEQPVLPIRDQTSTIPPARRFFLSQYHAIQMQIS
jgi:hypothetical protein